MTSYSRFDVLKKLGSQKWGFNIFRASEEDFTGTM